MEKSPELKMGMSATPESAPAQSPELKEPSKSPKTEAEVFVDSEKLAKEYGEKRAKELEEQLKKQGKSEEEIKRRVGALKKGAEKDYLAGIKAGGEKSIKQKDVSVKETEKTEKKEEKPKEKVDDKKGAEITKEKLYADVGKWREELIKREAAYKEAKKKGIMGESILEMSFEEAKKSYEQAKTNFADFMYGKKLHLLKDRKGYPEYEQELCELKESLFRDVVIREQDELAKARYDNLAPRKRTWFRGLLENYIKAPMWKRAAISTAMVTGTIATGGLVGGLFGLSMGFASGAAVLGYGAQRFVRGVIGGTTGGYVAGWVKRYFGRKVEEDRLREINALQNNFGSRIESVKTDNEFKDLMTELNNRYEQVVKETNKRHRNITLWASGVAFAAGLGSVSAATHAGIDGPLADLLNSKLGFAAPVAGMGGGIASAIESRPLSGIGAGVLEHKAGVATGMAGVGGPHGAMETMAGGKGGVPLEHLKIGTRGPEGSIIDYFKGNHDVAKQFGWDGKADLSKWAGAEAHKLWLEQAKSALADPETVSKMKAAGYPLTPEGYAKAMHHIGKGFVDMDITGHKINLSEVDYLKAEAVSNLPPQTVPGMKIEDLSQRADIQTIEEIKKYYELPDSKLIEIVRHFNTIDEEGFLISVNQLRGGYKEFLEMKASELFPSGDLSEPGSTNVYFNKFAYKLQQLTGDAAILHDGKTTVKEVLGKINPKEIFGAEYNG